MLRRLFVSWNIWVYKETTVEQVIRRILNVTNEKLSPLKEEIKKSKYSVHEIFTIASIAEKEANKYEDSYVQKSFI